MEIKKVGVLGCALMGSGIAQVCATGSLKAHSNRPTGVYKTSASSLRD
jgi:3-hydroxyacyl-CoA dehydrogenase